MHKLANGITRHPNGMDALGNKFSHDQKAGRRANHLIRHRATSFAKIKNEKHRSHLCRNFLALM